jgi:hypothetical protein
MGMCDVEDVFAVVMKQGRDECDMYHIRTENTNGRHILISSNQVFGITADQCNESFVLSCANK